MKKYVLELDQQVMQLPDAGRQVNDLVAATVAFLKSDKLVFCLPPGVRIKEVEPTSIMVPDLRTVDLENMRHG